MRSQGSAARAALLAAVGFSLVVAACNPAAPAASTPTAAAGAAGKTFRVGLAGGNFSIPAARAVYEGFVYRAQQLGMDVKSNDANDDVNKQISDIDYFIGQKVDAIIIQQVGDPTAFRGALERAHQAGIHLFSFDEFPGQDNVELQSYASARDLGVTSAQWLGQRLGGKGSLVIVGTFPVLVLETRIKGAQETFASQFPDVQVTREDSQQNSAQGGRTLGEQLLAKYPNLSAVWAVDDVLAAGVGAAVKAAGRNVVVTGLNGDQDGIQAIQQDQMVATWQVDSVQTGIEAANMAHRILNGEVAASELPLKYISQPVLFTKDNVSQWVAPDKKIPYPELK
jgi:ABC-type sugar transport system substrate-binding protein